MCFSRGLLLENLLHVADFAPHLPARFFGRTSITQVWISRRLAGLFFRFAFRFLEGPLDLIPGARFHEKKIASYELGGCNLIETEGDSADQEAKQRESPRAVKLTKPQPDLSSALLTGVGTCLIPGRPEKRSQLFICMHNEALSIVAVRIGNPDRSAFGVHG
jgi:hypothetical protein